MVAPPAVISEIACVCTSATAAVGITVAAANAAHPERYLQMCVVATEQDTCKVPVKELTTAAEQDQWAHPWLRDGQELSYSSVSSASPSQEFNTPDCLELPMTRQMTAATATSTQRPKRNGRIDKKEKLLTP